MSSNVEYQSYSAIAMALAVGAMNIGGPAAMVAGKTMATAAVNALGVAAVGTVNAAGAAALGVANAAGAAALGVAGATGGPLIVVAAGVSLVGYGAVHYYDYWPVVSPAIQAAQEVRLMQDVDMRVVERMEANIAESKVVLEGFQGAVVDMQDTGQGLVVCVEQMNEAAAHVLNVAIPAVVTANEACEAAYSREVELREVAEKLLEERSALIEEVDTLRIRNAVLETAGAKRRRFLYHSIA